MCVAIDFSKVSPDGGVQQVLFGALQPFLQVLLLGDGAMSVLPYTEGRAAEHALGFTGLSHEDAPGFEGLSHEDALEFEGLSH